MFCYAITRSIKAANAALTPEEIAQKEAYLAENKINLDDVNTLGIKAKAYVDDYANKTISANLFILQNKHPEFFKKPSDVYRLLKEIKNNPTHFFKNNRPDMALIVKVLEDGSVGKLGIVKESGHVGHLSKSTNKNEMDRLRKVNEKELKVRTPTSPYTLILSQQGRLVQMHVRQLIKVLYPKTKI